MKKIITTLAIFLFSSNLYGNMHSSEKYFDKDYIFKNNEKIKWLEETGTWPNLWRVHDFQVQQPWALKFSKDIINDGKYSIRFEKRKDDCGPSKLKGDCKRTSAKFIGRSEIMIIAKKQKNREKGETGEHWYKWSFYIDPESDVPTGDSFIHMGQWKTSQESERATRQYIQGWNGDIKDAESCPEINLLFSWRNNGIQAYRQGVTNCSGSGIKTIINQKDVKGKWHNFLLNINWTDQSDGKIKLWLNNKLVYHLEGKTISKIITHQGEKLGSMFRFGVYSQKTKGTTIAYFDGMRRESACGNFNEFNCNDLESQQITQTVIGSDTSGGWMNSETNEDQGKRERIIKTLITKITKGISKDTSANTNDIKNWVTLQIEPLDWDKDLDRAVDRKNLRNKLTEQGINKFK